MRPPHNTKTISKSGAVDSKGGQSMSWGAQNRSKDAKTPSVAGVRSDKPELDRCPVQPYTWGIADAPTKSHRVVFLRVIHLQLATFRHLYPRTRSLSSSTSFVRCSVLVAGGALFRKSLWHRCAFRFYFASAADPRSSSDQGRATKRKEITAPDFAPGATAEPVGSS